ncbi:MAG: hypothetical protein ACM3Z4_08675, partial [Hyphomicrobiales bacterium]
MQKAGNLSSELGRFQHVAQRASGIEKLALELRRDRVPLHDDGRSEAPKNVFLNLCDSILVKGLSRGSVLRVQASRTDHFVETVCQPGLVLHEIGETSLRTLQFPDFARNIGVFECFSAFRRFFLKLLGGEHETL